jgi:aryl sulfotransferase
MSFFGFERNWWAERDRPNVLLVHYNDLKADLAGEMRRVADFLGISVPSDVWPALVDAAGFAAMRRDGDVLMGTVASIFQGGAARFFHRGTSARWRGIFREEDLALYEAKAGAELPPDCARWVAVGRAGISPATAG